MLDSKIIYFFPTPTSVMIEICKLEQLVGAGRLTIVFFPKSANSFN